MRQLSVTDQDLAMLAAGQVPTELQRCCQLVVALDAKHRSPDASSRAGTPDVASQGVEDAGGPASSPADQFAAYCKQRRIDRDFERDRYLGDMAEGFIDTNGDPL